MDPDEKASKQIMKDLHRTKGKEMEEVRIPVLHTLGRSRIAQKHFIRICKFRPRNWIHARNELYRLYVDKIRRG